MIISRKYDYFLIPITIILLISISETYENLSFLFDFRIVRFPLFGILLLLVIVLLSKANKASICKLKYYEPFVYFFVFSCLALMLFNRAFTWAYYIILIPVFIYYLSIRIRDWTIKTIIIKTFIFISIIVIVELTVKWSLGIYDNNLLLKRIESNLLGRPITTGYFLIISLILGHTILSKSKFIIYTVITGMGVAFLNSRSITVAYITIGIWFYVSDLRLNGKLKAHQIYMIFAILILGITLIQTGYYDVIISRFEKKNDPSTQVRYYAIDALFDSFSENSDSKALIFGHGFKYSDGLSRRLTKELFPSTNGVSFEIPIIIFFLDFGLLFLFSFLVYHLLIFIQTPKLYMVPLIILVVLTNFSSAYSLNLTYGSILMLTFGLLHNKRW